MPQVTLQTILRRPRPLLIAHRGDPTRAVENTLPAFTQAYHAGADLIELDCQLSQDDQVVVYHDPTIRISPLRRRSVRTLALKALRRAVVHRTLSAKPLHSRIPTLRSVFRRFGHRIHFYLDLKLAPDERRRSTVLCRQVINLIKEHRLLHETLLVAPELRLLDYAKRVAPELPTGLLVVRKRLFQQALRRRFSNIDLLSISHRCLTRRMIDVAHRRGKPIFVWTVDTETEADHFCQMQVDGLITNQIRRLRTVKPGQT